MSGARFQCRRITQDNDCFCRTNNDSRQHQLRLLRSLHQPRGSAVDLALPPGEAAQVGDERQTCHRRTDRREPDLPGGSVAVKDGDKVIPVINKIAKSFENVVMTQDWHTARHISFASSHEGKKPFEMIKLAYGDQALWPDHCVQGTEGAAIAKDIDIPQAELIIRKGFHNDVDSYSAFLEADKETKKGLPAI